MSKRADVEDIYPLTPTQKGLLFHSLYAPGEGYYFQQGSWKLEGPLDVPAFQATWDEVIARHPVLRTSFNWENRDEPLQIVHRKVRSSWVLDDWSGLDATSQGEREEAFLAADRRKGFDLARAPLLRFALITLAPDVRRFVWSSHHAILDGWSTAQVLKEVFVGYSAQRAGKSVSLSAGRPYRDFIAHLASRPPGSAEAFWRDALAGINAATPLGIDTPLAPGTATTCERARLELDEDQTRAIVALARKAQVTLNATILAAWGVVLARYAGQEDVVFGTTVSGRPAQIEGVEDMVGLFINTLPLRLRVTGTLTLDAYLRQVQSSQLAIQEHEQLPLVQIQAQSAIPRGEPLFETIVVFENYPSDESLDGALADVKVRDSNIVERTNYPLTLDVLPGARLGFLALYDAPRLAASGVQRMLGHLAEVLAAMTRAPQGKLGALSVLPLDEKRQVIEAWNRTERELPVALVHDLFRAQARRAPRATALSFKDQARTYEELDAWSDRLARVLQARGVGPDVRVAVYMHRSLEMVAALLAVMKAGGCYVPIDPEYPKERVELMCADAGVRLILTQAALLAGATALGPPTLAVDTTGPELERQAAGAPPCAAGPQNLAYVIYTSGSTGKPKGVMLTHENVANFFVGMDERIGVEPPLVWAAVTSISFDISVLELFWTLARGFKVIVQPAVTEARAPRRAAGISLFYFASEEPRTGDKYRLLLEGARFADRHGFEAVWLPERHFHAFGGLFPNPAVLAAAVAATTTRVAIRAGSVVSPLHHAARIAEEWSVVDNLSGGRVGISFASGWHVADFVLAPGAYKERKAVMHGQVETVRKLWRGAPHVEKGPDGVDVELVVHPRPIQPELPVWLTAAGRPETFRTAGAMGTNVLTHLLGQTLEQLGANITAYHEAWRAAGHAGPGHVTLMVHTFVGPDAKTVEDAIRAPFQSYLASSMDLWGGSRPVALLTAERDQIVEAAFDRFAAEAALFGSVDECTRRIARIQEAGVDEIACMVDFGVAVEAVLGSLPALDAVRQRVAAAASPDDDDGPVTAQIAPHGVGYLQCTPSLARAFVLDPDALEALRPLKRLMLGGEALPEDLAKILATKIDGALLNMYGPTETAIWSTTHAVGRDGRVALGEPIANTELYLLDARLETVPLGVAGELYIGGRGVARGYHERPGLTAERFVPDPFGRRRGGRLYRTGDVVRRLEDGTLEYLGRSDDQVKIRGHRIEVGEIESALAAEPSVGQAIVVARGGAGERRLVAYVVPKGDVADVEVWRSFLRSRLPDYMVPAAFVTLQDLPLTPNGKVDRKALPEPGQAGEGRARVAPRTPNEQVLAAAFAHVLRVPVVGIDESFFELGGDSILSLQLIARVRKAGLQVTLRTIFEQPTVRALADGVARATVAVVDEGPVTGAVPLVPYQARFFEQAHPEPRRLVQMGLLEMADLDEDALERAAREVVRQHEALRLRFRKGSPAWGATAVATEAPALLERADLSALSSAELGMGLAEHARALASRFTLDGGLLFFATAVKIADGKHLLLFALHALAIDGLSAGTVLDDLQRGYELARAKQPVVLPARGTSLKRWAERLAAFARTEEVLADAAHWRRLVARACPRLARDPGDASAVVPAVVATLDAAATQGLLEGVCSAQHAQPEEMLVATLATCLARWTGSAEVALDLERHGRDELFGDFDVSRTVGPLSVVVPLRVAEANTLVGALRTTKEAIRGVPRHGVSFDLLRLHGPDDLRRDLASSGADVAMTYMGRSDAIERPRWPELAPRVGPEAPRPLVGHALSVEVRIIDGALHATFSFDPGAFRIAAITRWAGEYVQALRDAGASMANPATATLVASDFPEATVSQRDLDSLVGRLRRR